ncbi:DoxX family protein [Streptomyces sp. NPDC048603]|uniref:DoxX family protein n=1 Tax=Streptomyces sp. NPDC048603 TaxID=3365577 RepID=UPI00371204AE
MSVDTRTPRFDDQPALSMVKVPCDPAQVIVNHASFRVRLAPSPSARPKSGSLPGGPARVPALSAAVAAAGAGRRPRRAPVVWSGKAGPGGDAAAATGGLLQAVREAGRGHDEFDGGATQVIPRVDLDRDLAEDTLPTPTVIGQRSYDETRPLAAVRDLSHRPGPGYDGPGYDGPGYDGPDEPLAEIRRPQGEGRPGNASYYPDRRMNLGVVLLPLRVFLGFISIYAGMGKLCDPVYFDGGERGSMVTWLHTLHPWALAEPLRDFALSHPVGAGLTVAFFQVIVGVLTVFGLWQRFAACFGALLSAALLMTVSWKTVPAYDAPDIIYLAAWSPLVIAGAPVYSLDARISGEAWRTLGPRSEIWQLRRRVLRRGAVVASVVVGLTLLVGSLLGSAVRSSTVVTVPGPGEAPSNYLPGSPLPQEPGKSRTPARQAPTRNSPSAKPSQPAKSGRTTPGAGSTATTGTGGSASSGSPSATRGATGKQTPRSQSPRQTTTQQRPSSSSSGSGGTGTSGSGSDAPTTRKPGLVGSLLG